MLKANIEAQIECKKNERQKILDEILEVGRTRRKLRKRMKELLETSSDLYYEIKELEDQLND